jgi:hypothetical protein
MTEAEHKGPGHGDVILSLSTTAKGGGLVHRSWTICECSGLMSRLNCLLGPPEHETTATADAVRATADAVLRVPGAIHQGEGF